MRTTITITIATLALLAAPAWADDLATWGGTWRTEKREDRALVPENRIGLALDVTFPDLDGTPVHLFGVPKGDDLDLQRVLRPTAGFKGALGGEKAKGKVRTAKLHATLDRRTCTVRATFTLDGETREETWSRGGIVITGFESDGSALAGAFDAKRSKDGLTIKYRVTDSALAITARIVPAPEHPYASFYEGRDLLRRDLGRIEAGEHSFAWDGRDATAAKRIALGGAYRVVLESGPVRAEERLAVEAARFETLCSAFPASQGDGSMINGKHDAWCPKQHLEQVAALLLGGQTPGQPGFGFEGVRVVTDTKELRRRAAEAGSILVSTHGNAGRLAICKEGRVQSFTPSEVLGHDLKDVHFAFVSACVSGGHENPQTHERVNASVVEQMLAAGCDVVVGFAAEVHIPEADDFETITLALAARGCPITKAAHDAGVALSSVSYERGSIAPIRGDEMIVKRAAPGISPEQETLWPPRHGCSTN